VAEQNDTSPPPAPPSTIWIIEGGIVRAAWRLAVPMTVGTLLQDTMNLVDMFFVGALGKEALAAVSMCGVLLSVVQVLAFGIVTGSMALVSQAVGARNRARAEEVTAQSLLMAAALSLLVTAVGVPFAAPLLRLLGGEAPVVEAGRPYLQIMSGSAIVMFLGIAFASSVRAAGDVMTPLMIMGVANVINIELDPIMIYGMYGFPAMGVAGSALATVISMSVACVWLAWVFFAGGHEHFHLRPSHLRPRWRTVWQMLDIGVWGSAQALTRNISALALMKIVTSFGTAAVAAYGVSTRLFFAMLMPGMGFGNAAATMVGQNLGAGKPDRASKASWITAGMWAAISTVTGVFCWIYAPEMIRVFCSEPEAVTLGVPLLRWMAVGFPFTAISVVLGRAMNGAGDTFWPMLLVAVTMLVIRIPMAYWLAAEWHDVSGVWVAVGITNIVQGIFYAAAFWWGRWQVIGKRLVESSGHAPVA